MDGLESGKHEFLSIKSYCDTDSHYGLDQISSPFCLRGLSNLLVSFESTIWISFTNSASSFIWDKKPFWLANKILPFSLPSLWKEWVNIFFFICARKFSWLFKAYTSIYLLGKVQSQFRFECTTAQLTLYMARFWLPTFVSYLISYCVTWVMGTFNISDPACSFLKMNTEKRNRYTITDLFFP